MALSEEQISIIEKYPLKDSLDNLPATLCGLEAFNDSWHSDIASLLGAIALSNVSYDLPAGNVNVSTKLLAIRREVLSGSFEFIQFQPLVNAVVPRSSDHDIWAAVFSLIAALKPSTPPLSINAPTTKSTPIKTSSNRLADNETRDIVEGELFEELKHCTFRNVEGFWDKFFDPGSCSWSEEQKAALEGILTAYNGEKWVGFPPVPDEKPVWNWLRSLEERFLKGAPYKLHTTTTATQFTERKGQMDIFLQLAAIDASDAFSYSHVLVVGEQKKSQRTNRFKADFLQLARYVRSVFAEQPTRRFIHAFSLCASEMELWVFDRSGAYSSGTFDIHREPDKFARALVGYATMDDKMMGLDEFIVRQDQYRYVTLDDANDEDKEVKVQLHKRMFRQKAIVCRGTTCYETQNKHVAKFSWASDRRELEVVHLKRAEKMGVEGVVRVVAHRRITSITEMREGLHLPTAHRFRSENVQFNNQSVNTISVSKRKTLSDHTSGDRFGAKRRVSSMQKSKLATVVSNEPSGNTTKPSRNLPENRIFSCFVISPAGRVISEFQTIKELLESVRDAIQAHRSLYIKGEILHRDISPNNIIITNPAVANGFKGMLIDLDMCKVLGSEESGAPHRTGTVQFMAVDVLRKVDHTYRHDLESFFYVLIWMCARQAWSNGFSGERKPPQDSRLRRWEIGSFQDIADTKMGHMTALGLMLIMNEFPQDFDAVKPLCLTIRKVIFPLDEEQIMIFGTLAGDPDQLYNPIIAAFDEAISNL